MAQGSAENTPGNEKGAKLQPPMPNGQTRMKPVSPSAPPQPVKH